MQASTAQAAYAVAKTIPVTPKGDFDYLKFDPVSHHVFAALIDGVAEVDPVAGMQVGAAITVPGQTQLRGVTVSPDGKYLFIGSYSSNRVSRIDLATRTVMGAGVTGAGADNLIYDTAVQKLFIGNHDGGSATIIDAATMKADKTLPLMSGSPEGLASDGAGKVYVNLGSAVAQIDAMTQLVTAQWPLGAGITGAAGLAIDPINHRLFSATDGKLVVLDATSGKVITTVPIGGGPDGAAYDPATRLVFTTNGDDGTLSVIKQDSPDAYTKLGDVKTSSGCRTIALDPATHAVFTVCQAGTPRTMSLVVLTDPDLTGVPPGPSPDGGAADAATTADAGGGGATGTGGTGGPMGSGGTTGGSTGGSTGGKSGSGGSPAGSGGSSTPGAGNGNGGGCTLAGGDQPAGTTPVLGWLGALAGLALLVRRRRR